MSITNIFQISLEIWGCAISIIVAILSGNSVFRAKGGLKSVWMLLVLNCLLLVSDALCYVYRGDISIIGIAMTRIGNFAVYFIEGILVWLFMYSTLQLTTGEQKVSIKNPPMAITTVCVALQLLGCIITPFTGFYYSFNEMNRYVRGAGMPLSFVLLGIVLIIGGIQVVKNRNLLSPNVYNTFVSGAVIVAVFTTVQFIFYGISWLNIGLTLGIFIFFISLWVDKRDREFQEHMEGMEAIVNELRSRASKEEEL